MQQTEKKRNYFLNTISIIAFSNICVYFNNAITPNFFLFFFEYFRIRKYIHIVVSSKYFDNVILALILISSGLLAIEDATNPEAQVNKVSSTLALHLKYICC